MKLWKVTETMKEKIPGQLWYSTSVNDLIFVIDMLPDGFVSYYYFSSAGAGALLGIHIDHPKTADEWENWGWRLV